MWSAILKSTEKRRKQINTEDFAETLKEFHKRNRIFHTRYNNSNNDNNYINIIFT